jgi:hypothetical protein
MDDREKLVDPTVGDMIAWLSKFPIDTPFRIEDPDTHWTIGIVHGWEEDGTLWVTGEYHEMGAG